MLIVRFFFLRTQQIRCDVVENANFPMLFASENYTPVRVPASDEHIDPTFQ